MERPEGLGKAGCPERFSRRFFSPLLMVLGLLAL